MDSDVFRRQHLKSKVDPRALMIKCRAILPEDAYGF